MPPQRRIVRRTPLSQRVSAMLNPMDFWLWLSEELETRDWDSKALGTQLGLAFNFVFLLARANSFSGSDENDVFGDSSSGGFVTFIVRPLVWILVALSFGNAFYTMTRSRHYRLFEVNVEHQPPTPSAHRVKVASSPVASSPLRFLADLIVPESAESRSHPDKTSDVWELAVWDPLPVSMRLFCLFSPGHVLVYMIFLPLAPLDPTPSVSVLSCIVLQLLFSAQLLLLQSRFSQQTKDTAIIQKEVLHEYDTKYVHPRLHPVVRDVGTQLSMDGLADDSDFVQTGTPMTVIKKEFHTHANPYLPRTTVDNEGYSQRKVLSPRMITPTGPPRRSDPVAASNALRSSAMRQSLPPGNTPFQTTSSTSMNTASSTGTNFGGSMGVYTHANSPLKKATSMNDMNSGSFFSPRNSREMAAMEQQASPRKSSPVKSTENRRLTTSTIEQSSTNPFQNARKARLQQQERYPSRW